MNFTNESRQIIGLKSGWKFARTEEKDVPSPNAESAGVGPNDWCTVAVPHDWAIGGPFDKNNDVQITSVTEDGIMHDMVHVGRTGGLPITGEGWYRKTLPIPESVSGKRIFIEFDGVMSDSTVFLNGQEIGSWPFGYSSFSFELTDQVKFDCDNVLDVRVCARENTSRWYPGAGIYRNVRLVITGQVHVDHWGTTITTPAVSENTAQVCLATTVVNHTGQVQQVELRTTILGPDGNEVAKNSVQKSVVGTETFSLEFAIANPSLWDIASPKLYKAVSVVLVDGEESDRYETPFGIRSISFEANRGFFLNGRHVKMKGVCQHHDLGALGAAVNVRALRRQLEILQEMGCNAIRTSHNPPTPELLDLCDEMGFLVIDEAFDEWASGKVKNGYHRLFHDWAEKDLRAMIRRDRNHPCIIMWSIGNEIREQGQKDGAKIAQFLTDICHDEDRTRPVTAGFNNTDAAIKNGLAAAVDVPGWNYKPHLYKKYHEEHPEWIMYGSETASTVSSRGKYEFPAEEEVPVEVRPSLHTSSYDLAAPKWATTPDKEFAAQEECEFSLGEFVWTGFDYLGEPTPYREEWPSRSSYFGIVDLCGIPKDRYYLYQSHWSNKPVLHLLPHWNWDGMEGKAIPVHCYTS
ncbi:MAG: hypothetical protein K0R75_3297, partial [Paenibacillaceae bacterium]|nr:hypothetical protein [Paenibacillaceae bacterium]